MKAGLCLVVAVAGFLPPASAAAPAVFDITVFAAPARARGSFEREPASGDARRVVDWVVDSADNSGLPFMIVDKRAAKVFMFDPQGQLLGAAPALLGLARGDHSVPGIGDRELAAIRPEDRTTPAGRFVAALDRNLKGEEILWVDYESSVSLHRVIPTKTRERRLATPTPLDNRISYGCINVPAKFFDRVVIPAFAGTNGIVYVLPETRSIREVFASYGVEGRAQTQAAARSVRVP
jgi:hypothetical protein